MVAKASNFVPVLDDRSTTDGVEVVVGTNERGPSVDLVGSEKSDPSTC